MGGVLLVVGVIAVLLGITALATWGVVVLAQREWTRWDDRIGNALGIAVLLLVGLAGAAGVGCTAFVALAS
jgi:hypothetical protein